MQLSRKLKIAKIDESKDSLEFNIREHYIAEIIEIPVFNGISTRPYTLDEFNLVANKIEELELGLWRIDLADRNYNNIGTEVFELSEYEHTDPRWYRNIIDNIKARNEKSGQDDSIHFVAPTFDIPRIKLMDYYENNILNCEAIPLKYTHNATDELTLIEEIKNHQDNSYNNLLNLYICDILTLSKRYIHHPFNPLFEAIKAFNYSCAVYEREKHGDFDIYIQYWMKSFLEQSVAESNRLGLTLSQKELGHNGGV